MRSRKKALFTMLVVPFLLSSGPALAAKYAQIEAENIDAKDGPGVENRKVFTVKKGEWVVSSNLPTNGFYKVRSVSGQIGWLPTEALIHKTPKKRPGAELADDEVKETPPARSKKVEVPTEGEISGDSDSEF